jgi:DNA repair exonuclease SbcCD ATPase subunit
VTEQAQSQSQSALTQSQAGQHVAHSRGVEQAGENAPYAVPLGSRDVTLADKYLKDEGCARLAHELLGRGDSLEVQTLDLRGNDIRRYGAEALAELLRETASIERLNLEWNWLGDSGGAGLEALCDALKTNRTLTFLDLRNNKLNSECGVSIARLLICNRTLQELDLRWNNLGGPGGAAIADALVRNQHVRRIALSGNRIPASTIKAIEEALAKNRELNLSGDKPASKKQGMSDSEAERLLRAEQQVHDLHRELARVQAQAARNEQELVDEHRRCDELTESLAALRDESAAAKQQSRKNYVLLQADLERAQTALFDRTRLADADSLTVKAQQAELSRLQSELAIVTEDRARLLLAREQTSSTLNAQIESQHAEWAKLNEILQSKERSWMEERAEWEQKLAHQRRMGDSDKEAALAAAMVGDAQRQFCTRVRGVGHECEITC